MKWRKKRDFLIAQIREKFETELSNQHDIQEDLKVLLLKKDAEMSKLR
jgi:hypothetical protein